MKKLLKSTLSVLLCAVLVFGAVAVGGAGIGGLSGSVSAKAETTYKAGDIIEYGSYPQSKVTDKDLLSALDSKSKSWVSYGYYSGTGTYDDGQMTAKDYMNYADVSYGGNKYRAVTFSAYRPYYTGYTSSADNSYQDDNAYMLGTEETPNIFWFKFEPLKWQILDPSTGLVLSKSIIDSQAYNNYFLWNDLDNDGIWNTYEDFGDSSKTHYVSDYANSSMRKWLNDNFYNTAFTSAQKSNIATTTLNNDGYYTLTNWTGHEKLDSASTDDKIFLLSYTEANSLFADNASRIATGTAYAKCQGLWTSDDYGSGYSAWCLRSPGSSSYATCEVKSNVKDDGDDSTTRGVRPAMQMLNLKSELFEEHTLSYNLNGGYSSLPNSVTANYGTGVTVTADKPEKIGCTFLGWSKDSGAAVATYAAGSTIEITADTTLYAVWKIPQHTITFNTDGGNEITAITQAYGSSITAPENPTKEGYTFARWDKAIPATMPNKDLTITALWTVNQYTITFNTDGGNDIAPITQAYNTSVTKPANPTKEGYTFACWDKVIPATMPNEDLTITALWAVNQYTITFNTDGGNEIAAITQAFGSSIKAPVNPTKEGYTFAGWDKEIPTTMPNKDLTITAKWTEKEYTITFDTVGGTTIAPITGKFGSAITAPENPTKEGYTFAGWDKEIPATMPNEDLTITAKWTEKEYTITFDTVGGTTIAPITGKFGSAITTPENPTRDGFTFDGWDKEIPATMPNKDLTITAKWTANSNLLTYDANGGSGAPYSQSGTSLVISDTVPTKTGCTFLGWAKDSGAAVATYAAGSTIEITADTTLYAVWQTKQYTITFNTAGGTAVASITQAYGSAVKAPENPTKSGYTFGGWDKEIPATMPGEDLTLTALWIENDHLLTYDANGGSGAPAAQSGLTITVSGTVPTRSGYSFLGWSQQSTATAATYKVGNTIKLSADMTLYAVWSLDEVPIEPDKPISAVLNAPSGKTVDYKTTVTINVSAYNVPAGYSVAIFDGGYKLASGDYSATYTTDKLTYSKTYTARIIRNGTNSVAKDLSWHKLEKEIDINVKTDFFSRIIAFFRGLFNKLPSVTIG